MLRLTRESILQLHRAAISAGLAAHRAALFVGVDPAFVASLQVADSLAAQLLVDLGTMNLAGRLTDNSVPLAVWLGNAIVLGHPRPQVSVFQDMLSLLRPKANRNFTERGDAISDPNPPTGLPPTVPSPRVLIVNDVPESMRCTNDALRSHGIIVNVATTSTEAIEMLRVRKFDSIISDIRRGRVADEGIRFLGRIRRRGYSQPLIFSVAQLDRSRGVPQGASAICDNHEELISHTLRSLRAFYLAKPEPAIELCDVLSPSLLAHLRAAPHSVFALSSDLFRELIAELLAKFGWRVDVSARTQDSGYDIFALRHDAGGIRTSCLVECRHLRPTEEVQIGAVHALFGLKDHLRVGHAILATTGRFQSNAEQYVASRWDLQLRDYAHIVEWINQYSPLPDGKLHCRENRLLLPGDDGWNSKVPDVHTRRGA